MTKQEFETRVQMQVSNEEYRIIEEMYMNSDVEKDEFCKYWSKMNHKRIASAIKKEKEATALADLKEKVFNVYSAINGICWDDASKLACDYLTKSQKKVLARAGISLEEKRINGFTGYYYTDYKLVFSVAYEAGKFLGIVKY